VHIFAAAWGLSAVLASSASAFTLIKLIGAAYLFYMGISMLRQRAGLPLALGATPKGQSNAQVFWQGFATNVLNPKVALFFLAFVPQFIDVHSPTKIQAFLLLGAIFDFNGTLWNIFVAWAAAFLARQLEAAARVRLWLNRTLGALFLALGVRLVFADRS
jgi:threonine/homoserine/homoserine lactone efflux protein